MMILCSFEFGFWGNTYLLGGKIISLIFFFFFNVPCSCAQLFSQFEVADISLSLSWLPSMGYCSLMLRSVGFPHLLNGQTSPILLASLFGQNSQTSICFLVLRIHKGGCWNCLFGFPEGGTIAPACVFLFGPQTFVHFSESTLITGSASLPHSGACTRILAPELVEIQPQHSGFSGEGAWTPWEDLQVAVLPELSDGLRAEVLKQQEGLCALDIFLFLTLCPCSFQSWSSHLSTLGAAGGKCSSIHDAYKFGLLSINSPISTSLTGKVTTLARQLFLCSAPLKSGALAEVPHVQICILPTRVLESLLGRLDLCKFSFAYEYDSRSAYYRYFPPPHPHHSERGMGKVH